MALRDAFTAVSPSPPPFDGGGGVVVEDLIAILIDLADSVFAIATALDIGPDQLEQVYAAAIDFDGDANENAR